MSNTPQSALAPLCKAILMCMSVSIDPKTGTYNLYGVLDGFEFRTYPASTSPFTVFLLLTGSQGEQELWIEVHDLRDGEMVCRSPSVPVDFQGRDEMVFVRLKAPPLLLPAPGQYDLVLFSDGGEIDRLKFNAATTQE